MIVPYHHGDHNVAPSRRLYCEQTANTKPAQIGPQVDHLHMASKQQLTTS